MRRRLRTLFLVAVAAGLAGCDSGSGSDGSKAKNGDPKHSVEQDRAPREVLREPPSDALSGPAVSGAQLLSKAPGFLVRIARDYSPARPSGLGVVIDVEIPKPGESGVRR